MCTCISFKTKNCYFGRNLDLDSRFNEQVVITPRNYEFNLRNGETISTKNAIIGMATVVENYPLYAEATNEKGLSIAGLYFPNNAFFFNEESSKLNLTSYELIPYFLGLYSNISEIKEILLKLNITNISFSRNIPIADLHWMVYDTNNECIVIEQTKNGLRIYDNPVGVLTNNPTFDYHLTNLNNYINLSPHFPVNKFSNKVNLLPYSQGMGALGLPGDTSSTSRFIRATFNKLNSICNDDEKNSITQFFHILDSVSMIEGSTITKEDKYDVTTYSCCINITEGIYYYKTYTNNQITAIKMTDEAKNKKDLSVYNLIEEQQIKYEN